jgi:glycosyltransferase involved in cell wall biosynthesis
VVIDGGSSDESFNIIRKYQPWLSYWVSEKDRGQAHAINKGFARSTGSLGAYLNSDDTYLSGALHYVADSSSRLRWDLLIGRSAFKYHIPFRWVRRSWWKARMALLPRPFIIGSDLYDISQESTFWKLDKFRDLQFDENLHFCLDVDWYCQIARGANIALTSKRIGYFRQHDASKSATLQDVCRREIKDILKQQAQLGTYEDHYARIHSAMLKSVPLLLFRMLARGSMEFCYQHPL